MAGLTPKQERFVAEYLVDLNAAGAYRRAGYKVRNDNVAAVEGHRLLRNPNVVAVIAAGQAQRAARVQVEADEVLRGLLRIARADMRKYASWGPEGVILKESSTLSDDDAAAVAELSQTISESGGSIRFKLHDKLSAWEKLGKHLGLFKEVVEHQGKITLVEDEHWYGNTAHADAAKATAPPSSGPTPPGPK